RRKLVSRVPPPAVDEMIEAGPLDALLLDEVEDRIQVLAVASGEGHPQPDPLPHRAAVAEARHRLLEGPLVPSEHVVGLADPVQRDADVTHPEVVQTFGD